MGEERILREVSTWELELSDYVSNDFEKVYEIWVKDQFAKLPDNTQHRFFEVMDQWILYTYTFLQSTNAQVDATNRILQVGRTYDESIERVEDLRSISIEKLTYMADQQVARNRLYAFSQGGITGTGGWLLLGLDFPMMIALNLRSVQLIGTCFGYNMHNPLEMILALKVFHAGAMPKRMQYLAWEELKGSMEELEGIMDEQEWITDESWLEPPLQNLFKTLAIVMFKKKMLQGIPIVSVGIGAVSNYKLAKQVSDFAKKFYQYRLIHEKNGWSK
ncbi:EcsC family protein [Halalkalibacillus sediminis]|uniref:EcsC family protein n=1 Tax=Halalkalibacillus sediminis TaxID=2018042 RepID=UPI001EE45919|nr:EcsC family protein [Halalkalibacillus sediminis]